MKHKTVFHLVSSIFKKAGVCPVLIGGFAVNSYNVTRQTIDIDFQITKEDFGKIHPLLQDEGYVKYEEGNVFVRLKNTNLPLMDIDFMLLDKKTLDEIIKQGKQISIAGIDFIIPSLSHLIALKLHSLKHSKRKREYKDLLDIFDLIRNNKINARTLEFKDLCLKYGTNELYNRILEFI